jgi:UDP-4-amino-4,6-dideoxy-N-acetyl-beta-L-altrosamine N-acetyltransferase
MLSLEKMSFKSLQYKDLKIILEWRNNSEVRNKMKTKHVISFAEHEKWFYETVNNASCEWMVIEYEGKKIGVVGIKEIDKNKMSCTWGMYLSPKIKYLGLGVVAEIKIIDRMFVKYNIQTIWGEVLTDNINIMKIHKKCGFHVVKEFNGILMISMTNDGWIERRNSLINELMLK